MFEFKKVGEIVVYESCLDNDDFWKFDDATIRIYLHEDLSDKLFDAGFPKGCVESVCLDYDEESVMIQIYKVNDEPKLIKKIEELLTSYLK